MSKQILYVWYDQGKGVKAKIDTTGRELTIDQLKYLLSKMEGMEITGFAYTSVESPELKINYGDVSVVLRNLEELRRTGILQGTLRKRVEAVQNNRIKMLKATTKKVTKDPYQDVRNILKSRQNSTFINEQILMEHRKELLEAEARRKIEISNQLKVERKKKWQKIVKVVVPTGLAAILLVGGIAIEKLKNEEKEEIPTNDDVPTSSFSSSLTFLSTTPENNDIDYFDTALDITQEFPEAFQNIVEEENTYLSYEDQSQSLKVMETKNRYGNLIEKYSKKCGLDPRLMLGIATQESSNHEYGLRHGSMGGLMQIEISYWDGKEIEYYDFDDKQSYIIKIDKEAIKDVENNILIGCAMYQNELQNFNYNPFLATLSYNQGCTNTNKILKYASKQEGKSKLEFINNYNNLNWMEYTAITEAGDPDYVNKVFSYTGFGYEFFELEFIKENGEKVITTTGPIIPKEIKQL